MQSRRTGSVPSGLVSVALDLCTLRRHSVTRIFRFWMGSLDTYRTVFASSMMQSGTLLAGQGGLHQKLRSGVRTAPLRRLQAPSGPEACSALSGACIFPKMLQEGAGWRAECWLGLGPRTKSLPRNLPGPPGRGRGLPGAVRPAHCAFRLLCVAQGVSTRRPRCQLREFEVSSLVVRCAQQHTSRGTQRVEHAAVWQGKQRSDDAGLRCARSDGGHGICHSLQAVH
jgi:hypothetical protein